MSSGGPPGPGDDLPAAGVALIRERTAVSPTLALVTGSGLGDSVLADVLVDREFDYRDLPGFPAPSAPGHAGRLLLGHLYAVPAAVFLGRIHYYEGHGIQATTLIPRLAQALGARVLVLTNAAGGLSGGLQVSQLMLIEDHINFLGVNPLSGWRFPTGQPAFVDLAEVYDSGLREQAVRAAEEAGVELARGVYGAVPGPSYETPSERRFLAAAGVDAVGMSTIPEAVAAVALGLRVVAISCITNLIGQESAHADVLEAAREASGQLRALFLRLIPAIGGETG